MEFVLNCPRNVDRHVEEVSVVGKGCKVWDSAGPTNVLSRCMGEPGPLPQRLAGIREGRRICIWQATSAKADVLAKIIAKYQVPWKHLLILGAGVLMEPEACSGSCSQPAVCKRVQSIWFLGPKITILSTQ